MIDLEKYINSFYSKERTVNDGRNQLISIIVEEKINNLISKNTSNGYLNSWNALITEMKLKYNFQVDDMSYLQFPNLKLSTTKENIHFDKYIVSFKTYLVISLLCPIYTYYHEISTYIVSGKGQIKIGGLIFLHDKLFEQVTTK